MLKMIVLAVITLVIGLILGFVIGRVTLERQWSQPYTQVAPGAQKTKSEHGNPTPQPGTKVLKPMPIGKARAVLKGMTEKDPVFSTVSAVGANEDGVELHVVVENRGKCTVTELSGVAYGFNPMGKPASLNSGGENYVAFESKGPLEPGKKLTVPEVLKNVDDATLAVAHIDRTKCSDGTSWTRQ